MASFMGVLNALWIAAVIIARLDGYITWAWWLTISVATAPFVVIALLCWWAVMYDAANSPTSN